MDRLRCAYYCQPSRWRRGGLLRVATFVLATAVLLTSASGASCSTSSLGYQCSVPYKKLILHWSVNTTVAPSNGCTPINRTNLSASVLAKNGVLHFAVQSAASGYVSIGFAEDPDSMYPADVALGWVANGVPFFSTYLTQDTDLGREDAVSPSWAYDAGVWRDASSGLTTICFSRRLMDSRAAASSDLTAATGGSSGSSNGRRLMEAYNPKSDGSDLLPLIWAVSDRAALVQHTGSNKGGLYLDMQTGKAYDAPGELETWINVHGALMALAWGLLMPLGTLMPAHRWVLGGSKVAGKHWWFWLHGTCQLVGMALFIAGFVVAFVKFDGAEGDLLEAHGNIGIAVMAAAGTQVVVGLVRPHPEHPRRGVWNLIHHNLGRATVLLAWANVYIGIVVYHNDFGQSYTPWIVPIAVVMGLLVIIDLVLRLIGATARATPSGRVTPARVESADGALIAKEGVEMTAPVNDQSPAKV